MIVGVRQNSKGVDVYVEIERGTAVLQTEGFGIGRLSPILKALSRTRPMLSSLAGARVMGWRFTRPRELDAKQYGVWNYFEGRKGKMVLRIAYRGDVPLTEIISATRRFGGTIHYSITYLSWAEKWNEIKKQMKREAAKLRKKYSQLKVYVTNRVSGEQEEYVIGRDELDEFLDELANRSPLGRYAVYEALPGVYDIGPFTVTAFAAK